MPTLRPVAENPREWNMWLDLSRPRIIHLRRGHKVWITTIAVGLGAITVLTLAFLVVELRLRPVPETLTSDFWAAVPFIVGPVLSLVVLRFIFRGHRELIRNGELVIGRVIGVQTGRNFSRILTYEFLDRAGRLVTGSCNDNDRSFAEGMSVPVFFDAEAPETKQVALSGTSYEPVIAR
jgi:hypothetical protein